MIFLSFAEAFCGSEKRRVSRIQRGANHVLVLLISQKLSLSAAAAKSSWLRLNISPPAGSSNWNQWGVHEDIYPWSKLTNAPGSPAPDELVRHGPMRVMRGRDGANGRRLLSRSLPALMHCGRSATPSTRPSDRPCDFETRGHSQGHRLAMIARHSRPIAVSARCGFCCPYRRP